MNENKIKLLKLYGVINAFTILISGIYGFMEIKENTNKNNITYFTINIYSIISSLLLLSFEINNTCTKDDILFKMTIYLLLGFLLLGTSYVGVIMGSIILFYSFFNMILLYFLKKNNKIIDTTAQSSTDNFNHESLISLLLVFVPSN